MISLLKSFYHKNFEHPRCRKCDSELDYKEDYNKWGCPEGCHPKHYPTNSRGEKKWIRKVIQGLFIRVEQAMG